MPLTAFNLVLTGESFPVATLDVAEFSFRHRPLREVVRLPMALIAETSGGVRMQVLADRFEVGVTEPDDVTVQSEGLIGLARSFQEYVGRRTIRQVGHNFTWVLPDTVDSRKSLFAALVHKEQVTKVVGEQEPLLGDVVLAFRAGGESKATVHIIMSRESDVILEFNFHYELTRLGLSAMDAASQLPESHRVAAGVAGRLEQIVVQSREAGA